MFEELKLTFVRILGSGSVYPIIDKKSGKESFGFAFYYQVQGNEKKRKVLTANSAEEVKLKAKEFIIGLEANCRENQMNLRRNTCPTFSEVAEMWYDLWKKEDPRNRGQLSFSSLESREAAIKCLNKIIGDMPVLDIDDNLAYELFNERMINPQTNCKYSYSYMDKAQQVFRNVLQFAVNERYADKVPKKVKLTKEIRRPKSDDRFLDRGQIKVLRGAVSDHTKYSLIVNILLQTGLRQEELFALTIDDFAEMNGIWELNIEKTVVEYEKYHYKIVPYAKTIRSIRKVVIPESLKNQIENYYFNSVKNPEEAWCREYNNTTKLIFVDSNYEIVNLRYFQRNFWNYVCKRSPANFFKKKGLHMLRHSYASLMSEKVPAEQLAKMLGDNLNTVYEHYYSMSEKAKRGIVANVSQLMEEL